MDDVGVFSGKKMLVLQEPKLHPKSLTTINHNKSSDIYTAHQRAGAVTETSSYILLYYMYLILENNINKNNTHNDIVITYTSAPALWFHLWYFIRPNSFCNAYYVN